MTPPGVTLAAIRAAYPATAHMSDGMAVRFVREMRTDNAAYWNAVQRGNDAVQRGNDAVDRGYEKERYRSE